MSESVVTHPAIGEIAARSIGEIAEQKSSELAGHGHSEIVREVAFA